MNGKVPKWGQSGNRSFGYLLYYSFSTKKVCAETRVLKLQCRANSYGKYVQTFT